MIYYTQNLQPHSTARRNKMENYLLLQKNGWAFLLIRYTDRYHIITVNRKLDQEKEEKVLTGNCSNAVIDEMGLTRETIMKSDLRGVSVGGNCAGDAIVLHMRDRKLKYVLSDDYSDEAINAMFKGAERIQATKNSASKPRKFDWRTEMQTESKRKVLKIIGTVLDVSAFVCIYCVSRYGRLSAIWSFASLMVMAVSIGLYFVYPGYFTIMLEKTYKRAGYTADVKHINTPIIFPALALALRTIRDFSFPSWTQIVIGSVVAGVLSSAVMYIFSREVRENTSLAIAVLCISVFLSFGIVGQINHLANSDADKTQICVLIDTEREDGSRDSDNQYYCTVEMESGDEMKIPISRSVYNKLHSGDTVRVYTGQGALGIEYAYFVDIQ